MSYKSPYYFKEGRDYKDYETDDITITKALEVPIDSWKCPKCKSLLLKEDVDKVCFCCGYRYPFYNDLRLIWWIEGCIAREKRYGAPVLLSDREREAILVEEKAKEYDHIFSKGWRFKNKEHCKNYGHNWYIKNKEYCKERDRLKHLRNKRDRLDKIATPMVV